MSSSARRVFPIALPSLRPEESTAHISTAAVSRLRAACVAESRVPCPDSGEYLLAAQDEPEQTTLVLARDLQNTLRSPQHPVVPMPVQTLGLADAPVTVRLPRRGGGQGIWRSAAVSFVATVSLGFLGFGVVRALLPLLHGTPTRVTGRQSTGAALAEPSRTARQSVAQPIAAVRVSASELPSSDPLEPKRPAAHHAKGAVLDRATPQTGQIFLTTPGGGEVFDKGRRLGRAPGSFELSPGWHTLVIKTGSDDRAAAVEVRANSSVMVSVPAPLLQRGP